MGKTISFVKGRGHIRHNNRDFISNNVVPERTDWNQTYVKESIESAYNTCFGQALNDYNARQKRKDRQKHDYITEIRNSGAKANMQILWGQKVQRKRKCREDPDLQRINSWSVNFHEREYESVYGGSNSGIRA